MDAHDPDAFPVERSEVRDGLSLSYVRANPGGFPLLLVHGWPETKRIWWRNVAPLAEAGFEVIVPDLRGFGDSDLAPDERYDIPGMGRDLHALVHDVLGHERCIAAGGDVGGVVIQDMGLRFPGFVERQCLFNTVLPIVPEVYEAAGLEPELPPVVRMAADYYIRQATDADGLASELDTPERRRRYISEFYGHRFWAAPGSFEAEDVDFMTEPFADAAKLRAGFGVYEVALTDPGHEPPRLFELSDVPTLLLHGPADHVIWPDFPQRGEAVFSQRTGPFVVEGAGHFLQWEAADVLNGALVAYGRDLL